MGAGLRSGVLVRAPVACDRPALACLLRDMLVHYGQSAPAERLARSVERLVAPGDPTALVAEADGRLVGFAIAHGSFPAADLTDALFLRDIYVRPDARELGVGQALLVAVAGLARDRGCGRLEWLTGPDNVAAQRVYAAAGGEPLAALRYRVEGAALVRLARG